MTQRSKSSIVVAYALGLLACGLVGLVLGMIFSGGLVSTNRGGMEEIADYFSLIVLMPPLTVAFGLVGNSLGYRALWFYPFLAFLISQEAQYSGFADWINHLMGFPVPGKNNAERDQLVVAVMASYVFVHALMWPAVGIYNALNKEPVDKEQVTGYVVAVVALLICATAIELANTRMTDTPKRVAAAPIYNAPAYSDPPVVEPYEPEPAKPYEHRYKRVGTMKLARWGVQFPLSKQTAGLSFHDSQYDHARFTLDGYGAEHCINGPYPVMVLRSKSSVNEKKPVVEMESTRVGRGVYRIIPVIDRTRCEGSGAWKRARRLQDALLWSQAHMKPIRGG